VSFFTMKTAQPQRLSKARKEQIVMACVLATGGQLPTNLAALISDTRAIIGDVSEADVRKAIKWGLRQVPLRPRTRPTTPAAGPMIARHYGNRRSRASAASCCERRK